MDSKTIEGSLLVRCLRQEEGEVDSDLNAHGAGQVIHEDPRQRPGSLFIHYIVSGGLARHRQAFLAGLLGQ